MSRNSFYHAGPRSSGLDTSYLKPVTTEKLGQNAPRPLKAEKKTDKIGTCYSHKTSWDN